MSSVLTRLRLNTLAAVAVVFVAAAGIVAQTPTPDPWTASASPLPSPTGPVNDYAGVMDESSKATLNKRLIDFQRSSGVEMAVAVVRTTGERPIFDYSLAVARGWGIGAKEGDNPSLLLFVAIDDRKYFTQVSRDLEDELPDGLVGSIQRQYLVPEFRQGNYAKGISDTVEGYIRTYEERSSGSAAAPTPVPGRERSGSGTSQGLYSTFCCLAVIGIILLLIFSNRGGGGRGRNRWGGGGGFGGGGSALPWIIGSAISNAASSSSSDWGSSSSSSDWGSSGGGSDWGGFGGGGDFGGGGGGGDW
ncbi:MAG TPA: TPM domain-containing protein [Pyrinomonadaceae bacterium]|nr:TPM domain-containing protein [Pyrinomonadaceae bacterium]